MTKRGSAISFMVLLVGCSGGVGSGGDGGLDSDGGLLIDAGARDSGSTDAGSTDAGSTDAGSTDAGSMDAALEDDAGSMDAALEDDAGSMDAALEGDAGADAGRDASADGGVPDGGPLPACPGFESPPIAWDLPKGGLLFPGIETLGCPSGSSPRYRLLDIDGDGLDDLVVASNCGGTGDVGRTHWNVHRNTGAGFESAPITWPLPEGYTGGFPDTETLGCPAGAPVYRTFDIDADERPDLVITSTCGGTGMIGRTHWAVHRNTGGGFSSTLTSFTLPAGYTGGFPATEALTCTSNAPRYGLLDVDGDGDPDLVVTSLCDGSLMVGNTRWLVHVNGGTSFAASATDHALPSVYGAARFRVFSSESCPVGASPRFATTDLDGDRLPDLVVTSLCSGGDIGRMHWAVHRGTTTGFSASATSWTLPSYSGSFSTLEGPAMCAIGAQPLYRVLDVDGDDMPELVVTGLCSGTGALGRTEWAVHPNEGAGFGAALRWSLPGDYTAADFSDTETASCAVGTSPRYDARDLDGDGVLDLVVTSLCGGSSTLGNTMWAVHRGCGP